MPRLHSCPKPTRPAGDESDHGGGGEILKVICPEYCELMAWRRAGHEIRKIEKSEHRKQHCSKTKHRRKRATGFSPRDPQSDQQCKSRPWNHILTADTLDALQARKHDDQLS